VIHMANRRADAGKNRSAGRKEYRTPANGNKLDNKDYQRGWNAARREFGAMLRDSTPRPSNSRAKAAKKRSR